MKNYQLCWDIIRLRQIPSSAHWKTLPQTPHCCVEILLKISFNLLLNNVKHFSKVQFVYRKLSQTNVVLQNWNFWLKRDECSSRMIKPFEFEIPICVLNVYHNERNFFFYNFNWLFRASNRIYHAESCFLVSRVMSRRFYFFVNFFPRI